MREQKTKENNNMKNEKQHQAKQKQKTKTSFSYFRKALACVRCSNQTSKRISLQQHVCVGLKHSIFIIISHKVFTLYFLFIYVKK